MLRDLLFFMGIFLTQRLKNVVKYFPHFSIKKMIMKIYFDIKVCRFVITDKLEVIWKPLTSRNITRQNILQYNKQVNQVKKNCRKMSDKTNIHSYKDSIKKSNTSSGISEKEDVLKQICSIEHQYSKNI